ncbi:MAG: hypothetical protein WEC41_03865 [Dongiaceae bacterium]
MAAFAKDSAVAPAAGGEAATSKTIALPTGRSVLAKRTSMPRGLATIGWPAAVSETTVPAKAGAAGAAGAPTVPGGSSASTRSTVPLPGSAGDTAAAGLAAAARADGAASGKAGPEDGAAPGGPAPGGPAAGDG